jgi:hypothetical protein
MLGVGSSITSGVPESKYSADFHGIDDYIEFGDVGAVKSMSIWFSPDTNISSTTTPTRFVGFRGTIGESTHYWGITLGAATGSLDDETLTVIPDGSSRTATTRNFTAGEWYHLVISWNASNNYFDIYVNGVLETDDSTGTHSLVDWTNFRLGRVGANSGSKFNGRMVEVALWSVTLDSNNIVALYNNGKPINSTINQGNYDNSSNLLAHWKTGQGLFDDKANGIVHDQSNPGFGSELITNGDYSNGESDWDVFGTGWDVVDGKAKFTGSSAAHIQQNSVLVVGSIYKVTLTVSGMSVGSLSVRLGTAESDQILSITSNGTYTAYGAAGGTDFKLRAQDPGSGFFDGSVDDVSIKKLNGNPGITSGGVTFSSDTP